MLKGLLKEKTTWAGLGALVSALGAVYTGDMTWGQAVPGLIVGILGIMAKDRKWSGSGDGAGGP